MRRRYRRSNSGALMLWVLGLGAALLLTMLFCDGGPAESPRAPASTFDMAPPSYGFGEPVHSVGQPYMGPAAPAVGDYRGAYLNLTGSLSAPGTDRLALEQAYKSYDGAYTAYRQFR